MGDLISRQVAIDAIRKIYDSVGILGEKWAVDKCQMAIKDLPYAQTERKKGKWKLLTNGDAICSECGRKQNGVWDFDNWDNFCRHCGCDMRGMEND